MRDSRIHEGSSRLAPFPFCPTLQNGPRRPGFAPENLFKPTKDSPLPRTLRAPWTAAGRSENHPMRRERGQRQGPKPCSAIGFVVPPDGRRSRRGPTCRAERCTGRNRRGFSRHCGVYSSDVGVKEEAARDRVASPALPTSAPMSSHQVILRPWLHPCSARFRFTWSRCSAYPTC